MVQKKRFLLCRGVIFQKKKFCVFGSLSNMSKNGLRMVVHPNFDITHFLAHSFLSPLYPVWLYHSRVVLAFVQIFLEAKHLYW